MPSYLYSFLGGAWLSAGLYNIYAGNTAFAVACLAMANMNAHFMRFK